MGATHRTEGEAGENSRLYPNLTGRTAEKQVRRATPVLRVGMTILATIRNTASSTLRNWRLLAVVTIALALLFMTGTPSSVVRTFGLGMVSVGVGLNLFVILANNGRMPAQMELVPTEQSDDYEPMGSGTRFAYLGDWIEVREWLISPGDVLLYTGLATAIADRIVGRYWV